MTTAETGHWHQLLWKNCEKRKAFRSRRICPEVTYAVDRTSKSKYVITTRRMCFSCSSSDVENSARAKLKHKITVKTKGLNAFLTSQQQYIQAKRCLYLVSDDTWFKYDARKGVRSWRVSDDTWFKYDARKGVRSWRVSSDTWFYAARKGVRSC